MTQQEPYNYDRYMGSHGDAIHPRPGFVYPDEGDEIIAVTDYKHLGSNIPVVAAGEVGKVLSTERRPGSGIKMGGLIVHFEYAKKTYPVGMVIFWDWASDPARFSYRKPAPAPQP